MSEFEQVRQAKTFHKTALLNWPNVVGVKVWILARSASQGPKMSDSADSVYQMDDTTVDVDGATAQFRRRLYESYIAFVTPAIRRGS